MFWKAFGSVMAFANVVLLALLFYYLHLNRHAIAVPNNGLEWKDFVSILLTALGVMLAAMTLFLAVLAIWGFTTLKDEAVRVARATAQDAAGVVAAQTVGSYLEQTFPKPQDRRTGDYGRAAAEGEATHD